jgi:sialidase-1
VVGASGGAHRGPAGLAARARRDAKTERPRSIETRGAKPLRAILALAPGMLVAALSVAQAGPADPAGALDPARWQHLRDGLDDARIRLEAGGPVRVAFLGGSITFNPGWRDMVGDYLATRFPEAELDLVAAGIPSMGSTPDAFRLVRDVLSRGRVDLLFVEAAVNDSTNGRTPTEQVRGMEGIVRHARDANADVDIVMMHFADPEKIAAYNAGQVPEVIASHELVAERYGVASLNLALEVTDRINAGEFTWEGDFIDLHPSPFGQRLYAAAIERLLGAAWPADAPAGAGLRPHAMPTPLDEHSYFHGRLVDIGEAQVVSLFALDPAWHPTDGAGTREGFVDVPMLVAAEPGAELTLDFDGTAVGILVAAGPDAGIVGYAIDGGEARVCNLYTAWSGGLHLPWAYVLDADLEPGRHRLTLRVAEATDARSRGTAVRIASFLAN